MKKNVMSIYKQKFK